MWYDNSIRQDAKYWDKPIVTLKKNTRPICSSLFLCYSHNYWRLRLNHFHMGSMKTLQSPPQYTMRWLCLELNQQKKGEEVKEGKSKAPQSCGRWGGGGSRWRTRVKSLNSNHHTTIVFSPKNFCSKICQMQNKCCGWACTGIKSILVVSQSNTRKELAQRRSKGMSKQRPKSKSASASQKDIPRHSPPQICTDTWKIGRDYEGQYNNY